MFYSSRLIFKKRAHERLSGVQGQKAAASDLTKGEHQPLTVGKGTKEREAAQRKEDLQRCEDLEKNIKEIDELSLTFFGFVDGLFNRYSDFLNENASKKEKIELHKMESRVTKAIKKQFREWLASVDYCTVSPKEVESTMMRFYKCLESTVSISQAHVKGGMPKKNVYNDVLSFVKESPIGSDTVTIVTPHASFTYNQEMVNWASDAGKLENIEASFRDISKGFNFRGKQNANDYIAKVMDAVSNHPNFNKMDAYTLLQVLGSFAEQTEHFTSAKSYSFKSALAGITYHLDYL